MATYLAEKYYLEYLKKDLPSFQEARVYLRLGDLYSVASDPKNGIMPDDEKSNAYLKKVLQLEPARIDSVTIRARTLLASSPALSQEDHIRKRLDVCEWLSSLDDEKFQRLWLPLEPNQTAIWPISLQRLQNYVPNVRISTAVNAVAIAAARPDREAWFAEITRRFPDSEIADMVRRVRNAPPGEAGQELIKYQRTLDRKPRAAVSAQDAGVTSNVPPPAGQMTSGQSTQYDEPSGQQRGVTSVLADTSKPTGGTPTAWLIYPLLVGAVLAGSLAFCIARHRKRPRADGEA